MSADIVLNLATCAAVAVLVIRSFRCSRLADQLEQEIQQRLKESKS